MYEILRRITKPLIQEKDDINENYEALNACDSFFCKNKIIPRFQVCITFGVWFKIY